MNYTKELPKVRGFYWVKWANYKGFVIELYVDESGVYFYSPVDGKTQVYVSGDDNYSYSNKPLVEPK